MMKVGQLVAAAGCFATLLAARNSSQLYVKEKIKHKMMI